MTLKMTKKNTETLFLMPASMMTQFYSIDLVSVETGSFACIVKAVLPAKIES